VDVTKVGPNLTLQDPLTGLKWSNRRGDGNWQWASNHCGALNYNGVPGWRLPTKEELVAAYNNGITGAAKVGWMTASEMDTWFWSSSSSAIAIGNIYAWGVWLAVGYPTNDDYKFGNSAVVCVQ